FFSLARTKLPNYILPLYPPVALLTAYYLEGWRRYLLHPSAWAVSLSVLALLAVGVGLTAAAAAAGGALPELVPWAGLGLVPAGAAGCAWLVRRRDALIVAVGLTGVLMLGPLAAWGGLSVEAHKAPRGLAGCLSDPPTADP